MNQGLRQHKSASLRIAMPESLPEDMRDGVSEIVGVSSGNQRKGHATALLHKVCKEADRDRQVLMLRVESYDDGMSNDQLISWYGKIGFAVIQREPAVLMAREPK